MEEEGITHRPHWDDFSLDYDRIFNEEPLYRKTLELIVDRMDESEGLAVLELGCGTGNLVAAVLRGRPRARVAGVDPSAGMRARCEEKFAGDARVRVVRGDALTIPFGEGRFDCIVSNYTLHHLLPGERDACSREMARVLRPGGWLIYSDMFSDVDAPTDHPDRIRDLIDKYVGQILYDFEQGALGMMRIKLATLARSVLADGEYYATRGEWTEHLRAAGFAAFETVVVPPAELGMRILCARKA